jgi:hypothetical protein
MTLQKINKKLIKNKALLTSDDVAKIAKSTGLSTSSIYAYNRGEGKKIKSAMVILDKENKLIEQTLKKYSKCV